MNNEQHELTVDAARRQRLDAAMATRAARWCAEIAAGGVARDVAAGRELRAPANAARDSAGYYASDLVRAVWVRGADPRDSYHVESAWRHRALNAWGDLVHITHASYDLPVSEVWDSAVAELEAADAAITWQLEAERIAR